MGWHLGQIAGLLVGGVVAVGGVIALTTPDPVTVREVIDGDTVDVVVDGEVRRVRLLNVDAPETVDPNESVQCMGPEAAALLSRLLPPGTEVTLEYDVDREDRYGRDLAGVFVDDTFVNSELARAGVAVAVLFEPNDRFYDVVLAAQHEAEIIGRGLFDPALECTLPAQLESFEAQVERAVQQRPPAGSELAELREHQGLLGGLITTGWVLASILDGDESRLPLLAYGDTSNWRERFDNSSRRLTEARTSVNEEIDAELARMEAEVRQANEARIAEEARKTEEARLEAERLAAERAREAEAAPPPSSSTTTSGSSGSSSSGGYDGYTGCRAYGGYPPNAIDEHGRPYTKIDCTTKVPIP